MICDECKFTREPHEHRCLGNGCDCLRCNESKAYGWLLRNGFKSTDSKPMWPKDIAEIIARYNRESK